MGADRSSTTQWVFAALAAALVAGAAVRASAVSGVPAGVRRSCAAALLVDGQLLCDEERPASLAELCPGVGLGRDDRALAPGDALARSRACVGAEVRRMAPAQLAALAQPVDVNEASTEELASLPGIGPTLAARIVAGRPYASVDALVEVSGIGPKRLAALRPRARVGGGLGWF